MLKKLSNFYALLVFSLILFPSSLWAETRVIHVLVALCDNETQGIVPVPPLIGNGDDPANNLYWGAMYGASTYMKKQNDWSLIEKIKAPADSIYERLIFKSKTGDVYMVADAYAGRHIKQTHQDLFDFMSGQRKVEIAVDNSPFTAGSGADLLVYIGHNGLMDFSLDSYPVAVEKEVMEMLKSQQSPVKDSKNTYPVISDGKHRDAVALSCHSYSYYRDLIIQAGAAPLILTHDFMAPEGYILSALADGWANNEPVESIKERMAVAYNKYQKCGMKAARRTFNGRR